jgi:DNA primase
VLVVEGEKAADAARALFPDHVAVCWQGGAQAVVLADWQPMAGRYLTVWPDNDDAGRKAVAAVAKAASAAGAARAVAVNTQSLKP